MTHWDLKPRTVGELLDAAFYVYRKQFARLLLVAVLVSVPALVMATLYAGDAASATRDYWQMLVEGSEVKGRSFSDAFDASFRATSKIQPFLVMAGLLQSVSRASGAVTMALVAAAALRRERAPSLRALFRAALPRLPGAILVQLVIDQVVGCLMLCIPLGFVTAVLVGSTAAAIALERGPRETAVRASVPALLRWAVLPGATAIDGLVRSVRLTANGPTLARGTVFFFFLLAFVGIADAAAVALGMGLARTAGGWFWAQHYAEALCLPAWGLGVGFWYADLRVRREGLDLAVAA